MIQTVLIQADGTLVTGGREMAENPLPEGASAWIDIQGHSKENERLLTDMGFHPLAVEDTFTLEHQPKLEEYKDFLFIIVRGVDSSLSKGRLATLKLVAFLTPDRLVTFHRATLLSVDVLRNRLADAGRAPMGGVVHLLYLLCDEVVGQYFPLLEEIRSEIEELEVEIFAQPQEEHLADILRLRRDLSSLRQVMMPHRQIFSHLATGGSQHVELQERLYFRDVYDEVMRISEAIDLQREQVSGVRDTYLSVISQRTNEVMKVLTVISALLLPLTVITGVYGMNFANMPELASPWGYPMVIGGMVLLEAGLVLWFRKRGWL